MDADAREARARAPSWPLSAAGGPPPATVRDRLAPVYPACLVCHHVQTERTIDVDKDNRGHHAYPSHRLVSPLASALARRRARTVRHPHAAGRHHLPGADVTQITRQITYQRHRAYYWSWAERIGPLTDPQAAARKVTTVLPAVPEPSHG
jgi:hypothetical protein